MTRRRNLGNQGLNVSAQGLGCMGMNSVYGDGDEQEGIGDDQPRTRARS